MLTFKNCTQSLSASPWPVTFTTIWILIIHRNFQMVLLSFTDAIINADHFFLSRPQHTISMPEHALFIASYPHEMELTSRSSNKCIASTLFRYHGQYTTYNTAFLLKRTPSKSCPYYVSFLSNWKSEPLRIFKILRLFLPPILRLITPDLNTPPTMNVHSTTKRNILRNLYQMHKARTYQAHIRLSHHTYCR
jgi:hypothetical protein